VRDENLPKGKALNAIEVIIGECALEFTALYERDRVYLNFLWLVWFLDPAILYRLGGIRALLEVETDLCIYKFVW